jgi:hypothetical protein
MSKAGHLLTFDVAQRATCPESGELYELTPDNQVIPVIST